MIVTYNELLTSLANQGHLVIATSIPPFESDHDKIAMNIADNFLDCYSNLLQPMIGDGLTSVPVIGLSHSLGGKLMSLINSNKLLRKRLPTRAGNIFLAFNNYNVNKGLEDMLSEKAIIDNFSFLQNVDTSSWIATASSALRQVVESVEVYPSSEETIARIIFVAGYNVHKNI